MGLVQALDTVLEAARICAATVPDAQFVFVGGGVDRARLEQRAAEMRLTNTLFLPRQPMEAIGAILSLADAALVHLKDDPLFRITIPSKTQAYLALGRPVSDGRRRRRGRVGRPLRRRRDLPAGKPRRPGRGRKAIVDDGAQAAGGMGARGRAFYDEHLSLRGRGEVRAGVPGRHCARKGDIGKNSRGLTAPGGKSPRTAFRGLLAPGYDRQEERRAA